ncbi:MAG: hypothetical protein EOO75_03025 [Myxococcales bacterium]|nr:MAG: hypothetical protein EOO75_03025 [Myxococcales bacterium]
MNGRIHVLVLGLALGTTAHAQDSTPGATVPAMARVEPAPGAAAAPAPILVQPVRRESPWKEHPLAIEGQLALVGPLGAAGVALDLSLTDWFALNGGVGVGRGAVGSPVGRRLQFAFTPRLRIPLGNSHGLRLGIGIEAGVSEGSYREVFGCGLLDGSSCVNDAWKSVLWQNTNLTFEIRQDRFQFRLFSGVATPLSSEGTRSCEHHDGKEVHCSGPTSSHPWKLFNLGLALGMALW